jgi:hypothetical protein
MADFPTKYLFDNVSDESLRENPISRYFICLQIGTGDISIDQVCFKFNLKCSAVQKWIFNYTNGIAIFDGCVVDDFGLSQILEVANGPLFVLNPQLYEDTLIATMTEQLEFSADRLIISNFFATGIEADEIRYVVA